MATFDPALNGRPGPVLQALEGLRNRQALAVLMAGFLLAGLFFGVGNALLFLARNFVLATLLNFCGILTVVATLNAGGLALMDAARRAPVRSRAALLMEGAFCFGKVMLFVAGAGLAFALYLLLLSALFWLCRMPVLGPLWLVVILPVALAATTALLAGLVVFFALLAPALWAGHPPREALGHLAAVATQRPVETILSLVLLAVVVMLTCGIAGGLFVGASSLVAMVSGAVLGSEVLAAATFSGFGAGELGGNTFALAAAGMIALTAVLAALTGLFSAVFLNGLCHIWLQASEGIDDARAEGSLSGLLAATSDRLQAAGTGLSTLARTVRGKAGELAQRLPRAHDAGARRCPRCDAPATPGARFCTACGSPLEP